jgi:hypothetical protein
MKFLVLITLFILQLSCVWTTEIKDNSLFLFKVGRPGENESANRKINYEEDIYPTLNQIAGYGWYTGLWLVYGFAYVLPLIIAVGLVFFVVGGASTLGRSLGQQLFDNFGNQENLDALTRLVDTSIEVVTKLYY